MKVLIVEDDKSTVELLEQELQKIPNVKFVTAGSKASAFAALERQHFDLVINDLKVPTVDDALDADISHGLAVHERVRECLSGTPILILTGHGTTDLAVSLYERSPRFDVWGSKSEVSLIRYFDKTKILNCIGVVKETAAAIAALEAIEVSTGSTAIKLRAHEQRLLRLFARSHGGVNVTVDRLSGGLSDTSVFRIVVQDEHTAASSYAVVKIGPIDSLTDEHSRYDNDVVALLRSGAFAPVIHFCKAGAGSFGGIFYSVAAETQASLFRLLQTDPGRAVEIVRKIRSLEAAWQGKLVVKNQTIAYFRRQLISDDQFNKVRAELDFDWAALESREIPMPLCRQHADLHGLNVLIRNGSDPVIIDYGEVATCPCCIDPLTLELSILFHPEAEALRKTWPTPDQAANWDDVKEFAKGSGFEDYIFECRQWAHGVASRDSAVFATAYAYSVRQLKYEKTRHDLAVNIAKASARRILDS